MPLPNSPEQPGQPEGPPTPEPPLPGAPPTVPPDSTPSPKPVPGGLPPTGPADIRRSSFLSYEQGASMRKVLNSLVAIAFVIGSAACANTARGVVEDTKENASAVRGGLETVDVKSALVADDIIDADAIDVDTYQDKKLVVLRGSVPTAEQKARAEQIARDNAKGYTIDNRLAVVPEN
jgi:predicted small secreted protein